MSGPVAQRRLEAGEHPATNSLANSVDQQTEPRYPANKSCGQLDLLPAVI
jgi:hypothetical protein